MMQGLTLGITRRPASLLEDESRRVGGRVHAVVMRPLRVHLATCATLPCNNASRLQLIGLSEAA
jgi:hypothetical protein